MSDVVAARLDAGARDDAWRIRALKLASLGEHIVSRPELRDGYEALTDALRHRPLASMAVQGTPFFWKNVHRAYHDAICVGNDFDSLAGYVLRTGLDAFFEWLPDGAELPLPGDSRADIVLPALSVRIATSGKPCILSKRDASHLDITDGDTRLTLDLNDLPERFRVPNYAIPGAPSARLVLVSDRSLFDDEYLSRVQDRFANAALLSQLIGKSLELVHAAMPELTPRFTPFVAWYFALDAPDALTHNSMSVNFLPGVMFLSVAYDDFRLSEAMVHELYHNELYLLQESTPMFIGPDDELYYSPFRPDPRPLNGLFHALFVFTGVADFIQRLESLVQLSDYSESIRHRRIEVVRQIRIGIAQVPSAKLSETGKAILAAIGETIARHEEDLGPFGTDLPPVIRRHVEVWRRANPEWIESLRLPLPLAATR